MTPPPPPAPPSGVAHASASLSTVLQGLSPVENTGLAESTGMANPPGRLPRSFIPECSAL